jgi:deferrochelatase/peroxidase EfeB
VLGCNNDGEPDWCAGGTYQVVRLIRVAMPSWDTDPVAEQERVIGRRKDTGAPLSGHRLDEEPDLTGDEIAVDAHVRLANPRTPESMAHRIVRRSYSYRRAPEVAGVDDAGQIFVCYQRDVERGFATIQRRLAGEAMERYLLPFGGGYYFVLPPAGVRALVGA